MIGRALSLSLAAMMLTASTSLPQRAYTTLDNRKMSGEAADAYVMQLMKVTKVTGVSVAVIREGRIVFSNSYGYAVLERKVPLTPATVVNGASLAKATFAWMLMQLVDEGKVDLDKPVADYLPKPLTDYQRYADLKGDDHWRKLTLRILMNHTAGFGNLRSTEEDKKLRFHREPGARFGYSGEGVRLAQFVLETGLGIDVGKEMQSRIFDKFRMGDTSMVWRESYADRLAFGYTSNGQNQGFPKRDIPDVVGSMNTTLTDWARFLAAVVRGDAMSRSAHAEMIRPSVLIDTAAEFPTLTETRTDKWHSVRLGYGVGWGTFESRFGHAFFKEGHEDGTENYAVCVDQRRSCILLLSNDNRAVNIFVPLVDRFLGPIGLPAAWEGYKP